MSNEIVRRVAERIEEDPSLERLARHLLVEQELRAIGVRELPGLVLPGKHETRELYPGRPMRWIDPDTGDQHWIPLAGVIEFDAVPEPTPPAKAPVTVPNPWVGWAKEVGFFAGMMLLALVGFSLFMFLLGLVAGLIGKLL